MPYLVPAAPVRVGGRLSGGRLAFYVSPASPGQDRVAAAQANAMRLRPGMAGLRYDPRGGIHFRGTRGDRAALLSSLGCKECRTGLSWMGDDSTPPNITEPPPIPINTPSIINPSPVVLPFPTTPPPSPLIYSAPGQVAALPPNIPNLGPAISTALPSLLNAVAGPAVLPKPAASTSWLNAQTISGVPNKWLLVGTATIVGLAAIGKRR